ncbi:hypothetical protein [Thiohalorhabdus methylotrophus]|uniref:Tetratricopeptide repeat protein n=1 Tax=Thiohalorhabdus methylotrophus TaxID=3242694 RepID=A0ABV4TPV8_9GAMM
MVPPAPVALALAFGDRYLASDLAALRALVAASNMEGDAEEALFASMLELALTLNPAQEDSYYLTEAYLPWQGRVSQAQELLVSASRARPWDWLPPFFQAFNLYYFRNQPIAGAQILQEAADRSPPKKAIGLRAIAGRWSALGKDPEEALRLVESMAQGSSSGPLRRNLGIRAKQLRGLIQLRKAADAFRKEVGHPPPDLEALVGYANLTEVPEDPMGEGFIIDKSGRVRVQPPNLDRVRTPEE